MAQFGITESAVSNQHKLALCLREATVKISCFLNALLDVQKGLTSAASPTTTLDY